MFFLQIPFEKWAHQLENLPILRFLIVVFDIFILCPIVLTKNDDFTYANQLKISNLYDLELVT